MLRHKIKLTGTDANINIQFKSEYQLGGLSDDIENLVSDQTQASINDTVDEETLRFSPAASYVMSAFFYYTGTSSYTGATAPNEYRPSAINTSSYLNSFYLYKMFDSPLENNQNLIYSGYLNGFNFNGYSSSGYKWNTAYEYSDIHIPNSFLDTLTANTFSLYMKLNFYSAKSGGVYPFSKILSPVTESDLYNKMTFNVIQKSYTITTPFSFYEITNPSYVSQVNESVDSLSIEKPTYPTGTTFTNQGQYV